MVEQLRSRDHVAASFWSAVANLLIEIQKIKMTITPAQMAAENPEIGLIPFTDPAGGPPLPIQSANEN